MNKVPKGKRHPEHGEYFFYINEKMITSPGPRVIEGFYDKDPQGEKQYRGRHHGILLENGNYFRLPRRFSSGDCFFTRKEALNRALYILHRNHLLLEAKIKRYKEFTKELKSVFAKGDAPSPLIKELMDVFGLNIEDLLDWRCPGYSIEEVIEYNDPDWDEEGTEGVNNAQSTFKCRYLIAHGKPFAEIDQFDDCMNQDDPPEILSLSKCKTLDEAENLIQAYIRE